VKDPEHSVSRAVQGILSLIVALGEEEMCSQSHALPGSAG
jgi:hypothetical protein